MPAANTDRAMQSRAMRTTYRGIARREQIMETATSMFLEHGYPGVSVDEIMKSVGGSKTNLYNQFGGKEQLFMAVIEALCADFIREFKALDVSTRDAGGGLKVLADGLLGTMLQDRYLAFQRLIVAESGRFPALGRSWLDTGLWQSREVIARFIELQQRQGYFRQANPLHAATFFHDMVTFNPVQLAMLGTRPDAMEIEQFVDDAIAAFLYGYAVPPANQPLPPTSA